MRGGPDHRPDRGNTVLTALWSPFYPGITGSSVPIQCSQLASRRAWDPPFCPLMALPSG